MNKQEAINIVARHAIHSASHEDGMGIDWGCYPEIGESDWNEVVKEVDRLVPIPEGYKEAYEFFEARAGSPSAGLDQDNKTEQDEKGE